MEKKSKAKLTTEEIVAKNVGAFRFMLGLDYERFAERAHLATERIREIEKGTDVLGNGIELLRIAEACNIQYSELFEDSETGSTGLSKNAYFPDIVYKRIYKMIQKNYKSITAFAKLIGVHFSTVSLWIKGKTHPTPIAFQNTLTVLKLKSYDLEAMVGNTKKAAEPKTQVVVETIDDVVAVAPKQEEPTDDFESKVVKIMRLQKELPELIEQVNVLYGKIYTLKEKLLELS